MLKKFFLVVVFFNMVAINAVQKIETGEKINHLKNAFKNQDPNLYDSEPIYGAIYITPDTSDYKDPREEIEKIATRGKIFFNFLINKKEKLS